MAFVCFKKRDSHEVRAHYSALLSGEQSRDTWFLTQPSCESPHLRLYIWAKLRYLFCKEGMKLLKCQIQQMGLLTWVYVFVPSCMQQHPESSHEGDAVWVHWQMYSSFSRTDAKTPPRSWHRTHAAPTAQKAAYHNIRPWSQRIACLQFCRRWNASVKAGKKEVWIAVNTWVCFFEFGLFSFVFFKFHIRTDIVL